MSSKCLLRPFKKNLDREGGKTSAHGPNSLCQLFLLKKKSFIGTPSCTFYMLAIAAFAELTNYNPDLLTQKA